MRSVFFVICLRYSIVFFMKYWSSNYFHYGIGNTALGLFIFYLGTRFHKVEVKGQRSLGSLMTMEVPQGSIEQEFFFCAEIPRIPPASGYIGIKRTKNHTPSRVLEIEARTSGHLRFVGMKPT